MHVHKTKNTVGVSIICLIILQNVKHRTGLPCASHNNKEALNIDLLLLIGILDDSRKADIRTKSWEGRVMERVTRLAQGG